MPSWRPYQEGAWWNSADLVIAPDTGTSRPGYEVYVQGNLKVRKPSLNEAKAWVESQYGPTEWTRQTLPKVMVQHPLGRTTEFTDPKYILTATL